MELLTKSDIYAILFSMVRQKSVAIDAGVVQKQEDRLAVMDADELQKRRGSPGRIYHPPKVVVRAKN